MSDSSTILKFTYSSEEDDENRVVFPVEIKRIAEIKQKYKDMLLLDLYVNRTSFHADLANRLKLSASGLNAVIKKVNDTNEKLINDIKSGKNKFYSLSNCANEYVEMMLLPEITEKTEDKDIVYHILDILSDFKDKYNGTWENQLSELLKAETREAEGGEPDLGYEFLDALSNYYKCAEKKAEKLLVLSISNREVRQCIIEYVKKNDSSESENIFDILHQWKEKGAFQVYQLIDLFFQEMENGNGIIAAERSDDMQVIDQQLEAAINKIKADILHAIIQKKGKRELAEIWFENGMEEDISAYLAEKYRILYDKIFNN